MAHYRRRSDSRAVAKGLGDVRRRDFSDILKVRNRARDFQYAVIAARGQAEALGCCLQERPGFCVHWGVRIEPAADCERIAGDSVFFPKSLSLRRARAFNPRAN